MRHARVRPVEEDVAPADARDVLEVQIAVHERVRHGPFREPVTELDENRLERAQPRDLVLVESGKRLVVAEELPRLTREPRRPAVDAADLEQRSDIRRRRDLHEREHAQHRLPHFDRRLPAERSLRGRRAASTVAGCRSRAVSAPRAGRARASPVITRPSSTKSGDDEVALKYTRPFSVGTRSTAESGQVRTCSTGPVGARPRSRSDDSIHSSPPRANLPAPTARASAGTVRVRRRSTRVQPLELVHDVEPLLLAIDGALEVAEDRDARADELFEASRTASSSLSANPSSSVSGSAGRRSERPGRGSASDVSVTRPRMRAGRPRSRAGG